MKRLAESHPRRERPDYRFSAQRRAVRRRSSDGALVTPPEGREALLDVTRIPVLRFGRVVREERCLSSCAARCMESRYQCDHTFREREKLN